MLISTPIDAASSAMAGGSPLESGSAPENGKIEGNSDNSHSGWSLKAQKKNKPGIFAKLLEGLNVKLSSAVDTKIGVSGAEKQENPGISGSFAEKTGKNVQKTASEAKKRPDFGFFNESEALGGFQVSFPHDHSASGLNQNAENSSEFNRSIKNQGKLGLFKKDTLHSGSNSIGEMTFNEEATQFGRTPGNDENPETVFRTVANRAGKGNPLSGATGDRAKNNSGTENTLSVSFRDLEAEYQSLSRKALENLLRNSGAEKENSKLSEFRGRKSREKLHFEVRDFRTGSDAVHESGQDRSLVEAFKGMGISRPQGAEMEIPVDLKLSEGGAKDTAGKSGAEISGNQSFEDALAGELRGNLSTDIVRDATVIVRNGGEGTIRLSLRPASLGDVKIRLEMTENKITGHIIVESNDAFRAFERELPVLEKAFRDSGFSETSLDMSFARDGGNFGAGEQNYNADYEAYSPSVAASRYEAGTERTEFGPPEMVLPGGGTGQQPGRTPVNLLV